MTTRVHPLVLPALALAFAAAAAGSLAAQQPGGPQQEQRPQNLKVLPKDISRDSLIGIMRGFTQALGVNCTYCHVSVPMAAAAGAPNGPPGGPGGPREQLKPALDDKQTKLTARFMLRMVDSLNHSILPALAVRHNPPIVVSCATCHHGSPLPQTTQAMMAETIEKQGVDSAIAHYRVLRADMASGRYDLREGPVDDLATSLAAHGRTDDALKLLAMNQEFYPNSADIDMTTAEVYLKAGNRDQAIARYRAAQLKRPNDPRIARALQQLGAP